MHEDVRHNQPPDESWLPRYSKHLKSKERFLFSSTKNRSGYDAVHIPDMLTIVQHDCRYSVFQCFNTMYHQREGYPQGSPIGPGAAVLFASHIEEQHMRTNNLMSEYAIGMRWVDDVEILSWTPGDVVFSFLKRNFYGEVCVLKEEEASGFAGFLIIPEDKQIGVGPINKNIASLLELGTIDIKRLSHAKSFMSRAQNKGRIVGLFMRIIDTVLRSSEDIRCFFLVMLFFELKEFGFLRKDILQAMSTVERKCRWLGINRVIGKIKGKTEESLLVYCKAFWAYIVARQNENNLYSKFAETIHKCEITHRMYNTLM